MRTVLLLRLGMGFNKGKWTDAVCVDIKDGLNGKPGVMNLSFIFCYVNFCRIYKVGAWNLLA